MPAREVIKTEVKRLIEDRLLLGRVVRTTTVGVRQLPCRHVRVPMNEYSVYLKKYFAFHKDLWAYDNTGGSKLGDVVLIRRMEQPLTVKVSHEIDKICFKYGEIIDPLSKKRVMARKSNTEFKELIDWKNEFIRTAMDLKILAKNTTANASPSAETVKTSENIEKEGSSPSA